MTYLPSDDKKITTTQRITGVTGAQSINVFQITGNVIILEQYAVLTDTTTLTNCTNVYADFYDGTAAVDLTADGATLSGLPVGSLFTKDKVASNSYTVADATTGVVTETLGDRWVGRPFTCTQKFGADSFIRLNFTTTDNPIDFSMYLEFRWRPINGGNLVLL
jgi:hypothetical protein